MNGIYISCFVGDRLPFQIKGLDHLNPHSLQNKIYDEPNPLNIHQKCLGNTPHAGEPEGILKKL